MSVKKLATAIAFCAAASSVAADECETNYSFSMQNGEFVGDIALMDGSGGQSAYQGDKALNGVMVGEQSLGEVAQPMIDHMKHMEREYGLSTQVIGGQAGEPLVSDSLGAPVSVNQLATKWANIAAEGMTKNQDVDQFIKISSIVHDIQELGEMAKTLDVSLNDGVEAKVESSYKIGSPKCGM